MTQTLPLKTVRNELSELVSQVAYGNQKVVITKFGKPAAVLVTLADYEKLMNPAKRFSKKEWERGFLAIDKARKNSKNYSPKEIEKSIDQVISEVRQSKSV